MSIYKKLKEYYVSNFFLMIPACIILLSSIGSIATYYITIKGMNSINFFQLVVAVFSSMSYLTAVLGQLKKEITFTVFSIALVLEIVLFTLNLIFQ